jgi:excisionase family DNA binding protein
MARREHYESPEFMSVPEAARYLGVGRKMVYQMLENDQLIFARENGAIRILAASVVDFQASDRMT